MRAILKIRLKIRTVFSETIGTKGQNHFAGAGKMVGDLCGLQGFMDAYLQVGECKGRGAIYCALIYCALIYCTEWRKLFSDLKAFQNTYV